jgi:Cdc6-like AAA superfamily ATPase
MIAESLDVLRSEHVFDPSPRRVDLGVYHVPFDDLTGTTDTEARFSRGVRVPERLVVVGRSGSGKSSLIAHCLGPLEEGVAPIRLAVSDVPEDVMTEPKLFATHLVRTIANAAAKMSALSQEEREEALRDVTVVENVGRRERTRSFGISFPWLLSGAEASTQLKSAAEDALSVRAADEILERAADLLEMIAAQGLLPIVIVDDSDRWLQGDGLPDTRHICAGFFGPVLRMLVELPSGLVVAAHNQYVEMPEYRQSDGFLETRITLPALPNEDAIMRLIAKRVSMHVDVELDAVIDPECGQPLDEYYRGGAALNLRRLLFILHTALESACEDGAERVGAGHIRTAIAAD